MLNAVTLILIADLMIHFTHFKIKSLRSMRRQHNLLPSGTCLSKICNFFPFVTTGGSWIWSIRTQTQWNIGGVVISACWSLWNWALFVAFRAKLLILVTTNSHIHPYLCHNDYGILWFWSRVYPHYLRFASKTYFIFRQTTHRSPGRPKQWLLLNASGFSRLIP